MTAQILIVEDEAIIAQDLRQRLLDMGYEVPPPVASGEEAVTRARELRPELVLMDIRIKGPIDGVEAACRLRQEAGIPVVYLTAHADREVLERAKVSEPFGYILKPFNSRILQATIEIALYRGQILRERQEREELRRQFMARLVADQEEERRRTARDLHDALGQPMTSVLLKIRRLQQASPQGGSPQDLAWADALEEVRRDVADILEGAKKLTRGLHGVTLLENLGLSVAVERLIEDFGGLHTIRFDVQIRGDEVLDKLPITVATSLYRILQEALANVGQHAQAENGSVILDGSNASLQLIVEDDGRGISTDTQAAGLGLHGIRERAELLGGSLTIESLPAGGTTLFVRIPLPCPVDPLAPSPGAPIRTQSRARE